MPDATTLKARARALVQRAGEDVVVVDGATTRTVKAIVDRLSPGFGQDGKRLEARTVLELVNDPTDGIDATTIDTGRLRVRMALKPGDQAKDWSISLSQDGDGWVDPGMVRVQLR